MSEKKINLDIETSGLGDPDFIFIGKTNSGKIKLLPQSIDHSKIMFFNKEMSDEITKTGCMIHDMLEKAMNAGIDVSKYKSKKRKW